MSELVLDFGNHGVKWYAPQSKRRGYFRHFIAEATGRDWELENKRGIPPEGMLRINGSSYYVGDIAQKHYPMKKRGASRYGVKYYQAGLGYALIQAFPNGSPDAIQLLASHPPRDLQYADHIVKSAKREFLIEHRGAILKFKIDNVWTFDEPLGGFCHAWLTPDGRKKNGSKLGEQELLVIDAGGYTTDFVPMDLGSIDTSAMTSIVYGVGNMTESVEQYIRTRYAQEFMDVEYLDRARLESALASGKYQVGSNVFDCAKDVDEQKALFASHIRDGISRMGGLMNFDSILLTGGGSVLAEQSLRLLIAQEKVKMEIVKVDTDENMRYANVLGAPNMLRLLERLENA